MVRRPAPSTAPMISVSFEYSAYSSLTGHSKRNVKYLPGGWLNGEVPNEGGNQLGVILICAAAKTPLSSSDFIWLQPTIQKLKIRYNETHNHATRESVTNYSSILQNMRPPCQ